MKGGFFLGAPVYKEGGSFTPLYLGVIGGCRAVGGRWRGGFCVGAPVYKGGGRFAPFYLVVCWVWRVYDGNFGCIESSCISFLLLLFASSSLLLTSDGFGPWLAPPALFLPSLCPSSPPVLGAAAPPSSTWGWSCCHRISKNCTNTFNPVCTDPFGL